MTRKEQVGALQLLIGFVSLMLFMVGGLVLQDWFSIVMGSVLQIGFWAIHFARKNHEKEKEISKKVKGKKNNDNKEPHWITTTGKRIQDWLNS